MYFCKLEAGLLEGSGGGGKPNEKVTTTYYPLGPRVCFGEERELENLLENIAPVCKVHYENMDVEKIEKIDDKFVEYDHHHIEN